MTLRVAPGELRNDANFMNCYCINVLFDDFMLAFIRTIVRDRYLALSISHPSQTNSIFPPFTLLLNHSTISILLLTVRAPLSTSFRTMASIAQNNSAVARSRPMHCLSPTPNITLSLIISGDGFDHRSGSNFCGLWKTERFKSRE